MDGSESSASSQPKLSWAEVLPQLQNMFKPEYLEAAITSGMITSVILDEKLYILSPVSLPVTYAAGELLESSAPLVNSPDQSYPDCILAKHAAYRLLESVLHVVKEQKPFASAAKTQVSAAWKRVHQHYCDEGGTKNERWLKTKVNAFLRMHEMIKEALEHNITRDATVVLTVDNNKLFTKLVMALFQEHYNELRDLLDDISRQRPKTTESNSEQIKGSILNITEAKSDDNERITQLIIARLGEHHNENRTYVISRPQTTAAGSSSQHAEENVPGSPNTLPGQYKRPHEEVQFTTGGSKKKARSSPQERRSRSNTPDSPVARAFEVETAVPSSLKQTALPFTPPPVSPSFKFVPEFPVPRAIEGDSAVSSILNRPALPFTPPVASSSFVSASEFIRARVGSGQTPDPTVARAIEDDSAVFSILDRPASPFTTPLASPFYQSVLEIIRASPPASSQNLGIDPREIDPGVGHDQ
ncbi:hypothetical protein FB446DRAFT_712121 [Lentinula raphanica]|nr:hypothetical protein FB446DRAFT_712121 [Lentinula raphanica]